MRPPTLHETLMLLIGGKTCPAICTDVFDGGHGWYVDAAFPKQTQYRFSIGEQCGIAGLGERCLADFVSYPTDGPVVEGALPDLKVGRSRVIHDRKTPTANANDNFLLLCSAEFRFFRTPSST